MAERGPIGEDVPVAPAVAPGPPAIPEAAYRLGERVGRFAALTLRQLGGTAAAGAARAREMTGAPGATAADAAGSAAGAPADAAAGAPPTATARAEALVARAGGQAGALAAGAGERLRKAAALAREEAEDLWVEAQALRRRSQRDANDAP